MDPWGWNKNKTKTEIIPTIITPVESGWPNWLNRKLKIDTANKYFNSAYYWAKYLNSLTEGSKGILVGLMVTAYALPPFDFIAAGLTVAATTQMAVDAYREAWQDIRPYDGIPQIERPR